MAEDLVRIYNDYVNGEVNVYVAIFRLCEFIDNYNWFGTSANFEPADVFIAKAMLARFVRLCEKEGK